MEELRQWALAVCIAAIAGGIAHLASPSGGTQKVYKITVSLFFLCCILSPVLSGAFDNGLDPTLPHLAGGKTEYRTEELQAGVDEQVEEELKASLKGILQRSLEEIEVQPTKISINVNTGADGGILITEISILLEPQYQSKQAEISRKVTEELGEKPVLVFPAGGN